MSPTTNLSVVSRNCQSVWLPAIPYIIQTGIGKRSLLGRKVFGAPDHSNKGEGTYCRPELISGTDLQGRSNGLASGYLVMFSRYLFYHKHAGGAGPGLYSAYQAQIPGNCNG